MAKAPIIETLLKNGSKDWNILRRDGKVPTEQVGATFTQLFSAHADLSGLSLIGSEWEKCDLSKINFRDSDLSNAYFHGGRLQECDFRGANLAGATLERVKLVRCDFTGAKGLDELELEDVEMDRVVGINGEDAPPPPPAPAVGITSFTREQRDAVMGNKGSADASAEHPPFRPHDPAGTLLFRGLRNLGQPPLWVLDVPLLRPPLPSRVPPGTSLEWLYREAVKTRLENRRPVADNQAVERAIELLRRPTVETAVAVMYLKEVEADFPLEAAAIDALIEAFKTEVDIEDLTGSVDPRVTGALAALKAYAEPLEHIGELRQRSAASRLYSALMEAGFFPDNNWEEALEASEAASDLAFVATQDNRELLAEGFRTFANLPDEPRLRRLAYLGESTLHVEAMLKSTE